MAFVFKQVTVLRLPDQSPSKAMASAQSQLPVRAAHVSLLLQPAAVHLVGVARYRCSPERQQADPAAHCPYAQARLRRPPLARSASPSVPQVVAPAVSCLLWLAHRQLLVAVCVSRADTERLVVEASMCRPDLLDRS